LRHLCRTNEIDLARLPVRTITDQYVAHLEAIEFRDLETAGAYLVMAATLIYLKSKLLVPPDPSDAEVLDEEGEALRLELEERLRAYAHVKALGAWLGVREAEQALLWGRPAGALPPAEEVPLEDLSVHLLERAVRRLCEEQLRARPREVEAARALVEELSVRYAARGLQIVEVGGGYRMVTRAELQPWLVRLTRSRTKQRLSRPALETLAIVAYKQPVSRPEVDAIRGVNSEAVLENLLERRLIRIPGRKDAPGRPYLFETTREFLVAFGLRDLGDLP